MKYFYVYILQCSDGSYYVGHTDDIELRYAQHIAGEGASYTSKRLPVKLVFCEPFADRADAIILERKIKGWRREKKEALINKKTDLLPELSKCKNSTSSLLRKPFAPFDFAPAVAQAMARRQGERRGERQGERRGAQAHSTGSGQATSTSLPSTPLRANGEQGELETKQMAQKHSSSKQLINLFALFISALCTASITCLEQERIALFNSTITVHQNSSMTVQEEIVVNSTGNQIRHGLVREFPTTYTDAQHNQYVVGFHVSAVTINGKQAPYHQEYWRNGVRLYIGDKDTILAPGRYAFGITYETNRQLGFFKDHDELFWNVTGNGWRLPIEQAKATIAIPGSIPPNDIKIQAYTGNQGQYGTAYTGAVTGPSTIQFATTQSLLPKQGLTIVVGWPKGLVTPPGTLQQLMWFLRDNLGLLWLLLGLLIVILFYLITWRSVRAKRIAGTIIPEFEPPADMTASAVRYVARMDYDNTAFAAHIVQLAVAGYITIDYKPGFFSGTYTLNKLEKTPDDRTDQQLIKTLFGNSTSITLNKSNNPWVQQANTLLKEQITGSYDSYLTNNFGSIGVGITISALTAAVFLLVPTTPFMIAGGVLLAFVNALALWALKSYTDQGQPVANHIAGFKMFLETTEAERMKLMNAPDRTPELYETYLPYAIALGVEQQWTRQFASVFAKLAQAGTAYQPSWYVGSYYWGAPVFDAGAFSSNFANSFANAIAASATPPGSKSGFGGSSGNGGGSGGGGGGGGGGGW